MLKGQYSYTILWAIFFEKLLKYMDGFVMVSDDKGHIIFANDNYLGQFDCKKNRTSDKKWIDTVVPSNKRKMVKDKFNLMKKENTLCRYNVPMITNKDKKVDINWVGMPLNGKKRSVYLLIGKEQDSAKKKYSKQHFSPHGKLKEEYERIVDILFKASMESEPETASHSAKVMLFSVSLARKLKLSKTRIKKIKIAALLHDLGKLAIDETVLFKKGKLSKDEYDQIKNHAHWGSEIVGLLYFLDDIVPIVANHHENYDGTGYPMGLQGEEIPIEAKILSVADIYEALIADRPYRKGFSKEEAVAIIKGERSRKLDPKVTDIFLKMLDSDEFDLEETQD